MLKYKCEHARIDYQEVNEAFSYPSLLSKCSHTERDNTRHSKSQR